MPPVAARIHERLPGLPPAEKRVAMLLLGDDPLAGLESMSTLASRAQTSAPSVHRLVNKLGFDGYADFQTAVKEEVAARLSSPAEAYPHVPDRADLTIRMLKSLGESVQRCAQNLPPDDLQRVVGLLADESLQVLTVGGRFSDPLAAYLAYHMQLLRVGVTAVPRATSQRALTLLDADEGSMVVAFDYRRYQPDTVSFGRAAVRQGASLVLFTDQYLSPLSTQADVVLPTDVGSVSPFDSLTTAVALVESLVAGVVKQLGDRPRARLLRYDVLTEHIAPTSQSEGTDE